MTQQELAESLDVDVKTISNYEGERGFPRPDFLDRLSVILDRPLAWFFLEDGQRIENGEKTVTPEEALLVFTELVDQAGPSKPIAIPIRRFAVEKMRSHRNKRVEEQADEA